MTISVKIQNPADGKEVEAEDAYLKVIQASYPSNDNDIKVFPFAEYFSLDGDGSSIDMRVDGSVIEKDFQICADNDSDIYITNLMVILADAGMSDWDEFGNKSSLTNGCELKWSSLKRETTFLTDISTNFELAAMCIFGGIDFYRSGMRGRMSNVIGSAEGFVPILDLKQIIPPWGLRLRKGTTEKLSFIIKDDLSSGLNLLRIRAYGFYRVENGNE